MSLLKLAAFVTVAVLLISFCSDNVAQADSQGVSVAVHVSSQVITVTASYHVDVPPREAWAVLIDFNHAAYFLPGLEYSQIESQSQNTLTVRQKGRTRHGPFSFSFESLREIDLAPFTKITSHLIDGTMKAVETETSLEPEGDGTRVTDYRETMPNTHVPVSFVQGFIESDARNYYERLRNEMIRRRDIAAAQLQSAPPLQQKKACESEGVVGRRCKFNTVCHTETTGWAEKEGNQLELP